MAAAAVYKCCPFTYQLQWEMKVLSIHLPFINKVDKLFWEGFVVGQTRSHPLNHLLQLVKHAHPLPVRKPTSRQLHLQHARTQKPTKLNKHPITVHIPAV